MKNIYGQDSDDLMDDEGWEFWKQFCMVVVLCIAVPVVILVLIGCAIKLPVAITGMLKMLGGAV
jgi:ABC-type amino acid transport system permease subunit